MRLDQLLSQIGLYFDRASGRARVEHWRRYDVYCLLHPAEVAPRLPVRAPVRLRALL